MNPTEIEKQQIAAQQAHFAQIKDQLDANTAFIKTEQAIAIRKAHEENIVIGTLVEAVNGGEHQVRVKWFITDELTKWLEDKNFKVSREKVWERRTESWVETTDISWAHACIAV